MKNKEIIIPILNSEYKAIVCWGDSKYVTKILKLWWFKLSHEEVAEELKDRRGVTFYNGHISPPVIALPKKPKTPAELGTLAHEATHAIRFIFTQVSEESSDEIFAHSVGAIVRKVLESI